MLGAERTPEAFVYDADRRLVYHGAVDDARDEESVTERYLRDAIEAALAGETPPVTDTPRRRLLGEVEELGDELARPRSERHRRRRDCDRSLLVPVNGDHLTTAHEEAASLAHHPPASYELAPTAGSSEVDLELDGQHVVSPSHADTRVAARAVDTAATTPAMRKPCCCVRRSSNANARSTSPGAT